MMKYYDLSLMTIDISQAGVSYKLELGDAVMLQASKEDLEYLHELIENILYPHRERYQLESIIGELNDRIEILVDELDNHRRM